MLLNTYYVHALFDMYTVYVLHVIVEDKSPQQLLYQHLTVSNIIMVSSMV